MYTYKFTRQLHMYRPVDINLHTYKFTRQLHMYRYKFTRQLHMYRPVDVYTHVYTHIHTHTSHKFTHIYTHTYAKCTCTNQQPNLVYSRPHELTSRTDRITNTFISTHLTIYVTRHHPYTYGMPTISRLLKFIILFCKRALEKRLYSAKESYNFTHDQIDHPNFARSNTHLQPTVGYRTCHELKRPHQLYII